MSFPRAARRGLASLYHYITEQSHQAVIGKVDYGVGVERQTLRRCVHALSTHCRAHHSSASVWEQSVLTSHPFSRCLHAGVPAQKVVKVEVPSLGDENVRDGQLAEFVKAPGEVVMPDEVVAKVDTDKATTDVNYTGFTPAVLKATSGDIGDTVEVGQAIAELDDDPAAVEAAGGTGSSASKAAPEEAPAAPAAPAPSTPPPKPAPAPAAPTPPPAAAPAPETGKRGERRVKMSRMRLRVGERLKGSQNTYAMLTTFNEIDMTNIMAIRSQYKDAFLQAHGVKLGFMSAFAKAASSALEMLPAVNGHIDGDEIVYRDYVDISVAVATPKGLVVPVLRNVEEMRFVDVEKEIMALGVKARDGTITVDEMKGGTFTISNGGVYGSLLSTPIINPPQSAILGMHSIQQRPMVINGQVTPRPMMYVALSYDHRLVDGREAVTFLKRIKDVIEDPVRLLLDV